MRRRANAWEVYWRVGALEDQFRTLKIIGIVLLVLSTVAIELNSDCGSWAIFPVNLQTSGNEHAIYKCGRESSLNDASVSLCVSLYESNWESLA